MLPYTGTYAALGTAIENGFRLYVQEQGGKLGGREIEYFKVDDESEPSKAVDNINKLIKRDNVDVVVGTVHSGVVMAMAKVAQGHEHAARSFPTPARAPSPARCARPTSSAARSPTGSRATRWARSPASSGAKKVVTITWKYAAGDESVAGLQGRLRDVGRPGRQGADAAVPERRVPGAADRDRGDEARRRLRVLRRRRRRQVRQGLRGRGAQQDDPAVRPGLPHRRHARGAGRGRAGTARRRCTTPTASNIPKDKAFRADYAKAYKAEPDVYAVQGYDAAQLLGAGLAAVKGDVAKRDGMVAAMETARDRQPARHVHAVEGARPGAGHLPAQGRRHAEQVRRRRRQGARGAGAGLQDVMRRRKVSRRCGRTILRAVEISPPARDGPSPAS